MANTTFFKKTDEDVSQITWKDLFSESLKHHTKEDLEYALIAGTEMDGTTEETMLQKWRKPWVYLRFLGIGAAVLILLLVLEFVQENQLLMEVVSYPHLIAIIGSIVVPVGILIFFWETNIPRNITWYQLLFYFVMGAVLSFFVTAVMWIFVKGTATRAGIDFEFASMAAFREEPAKLAAGVVILCLFYKKKVYGLTGLVIGAAVGAGFGAFESISYGLENGRQIVLLRAFLAIGGHTLLCAPYLAAIALHSPNGKVGLESFYNADFVRTFLVSTVGHFLWNSGLYEYIYFLSYFQEEKLARIMNSEELLNNTALSVHRVSFAIEIVVTIALWWSCIWILRKCLKQVTDIGKKKTAPAAASSSVAAVGIQLRFTGGPLDGKNVDIRSGGPI